MIQNLKISIEPFALDTSQFGRKQKIDRIFDQSPSTIKRRERIDGTDYGKARSQACKEQPTHTGNSQELSDGNG